MTILQPGEMGRCLRVARIRQIMPQLGIHAYTVFGCPCRDVHGNLPEGLEMRRGIPVPPDMISNDGDTPVQECPQFGKMTHPGQNCHSSKVRATLHPSGRA